MPDRAYRTLPCTWAKVRAQHVAACPGDVHTLNMSGPGQVVWHSGIPPLPPGVYCTELNSMGGRYVEHLCVRHSQCH